MKKAYMLIYLLLTQVQMYANCETSSGLNNFLLLLQEEIIEDESATAKATRKEEQKKHVEEEIPSAELEPKDRPAPHDPEDASFFQTGVRF